MLPTWILAAFSLAGVCLAQQQQPQCLNEMRAFHQCMANSTKLVPSSKPPDFSAIKQEADQCFTESGCSEPQPARFQDQTGAGGRAGPQPGNNDANMQCFKSVHDQVEDEFVKCMQSKDPDFGKGGVGGGPAGGPPPGGMGGPPPGGPPPGGPGGSGGSGGPPSGGSGGSGGPHPGGPGGSGGPHPGGPAGFGGPPPGGPPLDMLTKLCNNDETKAKKLQSCLERVKDRHKPSKEEVKARFDAHCQAESTCKPRLGQCEEILKKRAQNLCECQEQVRAKAEAAFKRETSCTNVKLPPKLEAAEKPDCGKPPPNPCEEGFDKFYEKMSKGPGGGPPPGSPQQGPPAGTKGSQ